MNTKKLIKSSLSTHRVAYSFLAVLLLLIIFYAIFSRFNPALDTSFLGEFSTFLIALLTVAYVLTTNNQLRVMTSQLEEMKKSRELLSQPLPGITIEKIYLEVPRYFYSPPEDEYSCATRLFVNFKINNYSEFPATNVIISAALAIPESEGSEIINTASAQTNIISANSTYPDTDKGRDHFMFNPEKNDSLVKSLRQTELGRDPILTFRIIYKNVLGASFAVYFYYELFVKDEKDEEVLKGWHSKIVSFPVEYKTQIFKLRSAKKNNSPEWDALRKTLREEVNSKFTDEELIIQYSQLPNSFRVVPIDKEEYEQIASKQFFGQRIPFWYECDFDKKEK
jgi:hypothetical protein